MAKRGFNWGRFFKKLYKLSFEADITGSAAQVAFYFSFALFPLLYFLISLFGMILDSSDGVRKELLSYLDQVMPYAVYELVSKVIDEIVTNSTGSKAVIGLAIALWSTSAGVDALRNSLNNVYGLKESRAWWWTKLQSLICTFAIAILVAVVLATVFYGWQLVKLGLDATGLEITSPIILVLVQWVSTLLVMLFACEIIYNLLPNFKQFRWIWITYGSLVAIALWLILTTGFRVYLGYFNTYNRTYGSLGAVIIMMLWLYLTALALMVGGAINAVLREMRHGQADAVEKEV
jgi:membrane protein